MTSMKIPFAALVLVMAGCNAFGVTRSAASASYADVNAAIGISADGDTVIIPGGTAAWGSTLTITKSINLIGNGTNATRVSRSGNFISIAPAADKPVRISGIWFQQGAAGTSITVRGKIQSLRIDHCLFTGGKRTIYPTGWVYGVIDHNKFLNCDIAIAPQGNEGSNDNIAWLRPLQMGTTNFLCIEDNWFRLDSSAGDLNEQLYHQESARTVTRYNVFDATGKPSPGWFFDAHGNQQIWNGDPNSTSNIRSTIGGEIYRNRFIRSEFRVFNLRGGSWLIYSNTWDNTATINLTEEEGWQTQFFNPLDTTWPASEQITNTFIWSNTNSGGLVTSPNLPQASDSIFIQENRDYWMHAPESGQMHYPYAALAYPHPLQTGSPAILIAPQNLTVTNGQAIQFYATNYSGESPVEVGSSCLWTSSIPAVVSINRTSGLAQVNGNDIFRPIISATLSNITANTFIFVTNTPAIYPAKISDVWFVPNPAFPLPTTWPQVTWVTDRPTTTELSTLECSIGTNVTTLDTNLVTAHSVYLTGCLKTLVSVSITATDVLTNRTPPSVYRAAFAAGASPMRMCCDEPFMQAGGIIVAH